MKCPYCESENNRVTDSRPFDKGFKVRRKRICYNCDERFTTLEIAVEQRMTRVSVWKMIGSDQAIYPND